MPRNQEHIGAKERAAVRRERALALRVEGHSFRKIGRALGITGPRAHQLVSEALGKLAALEKGRAEQQRQLDLARIDATLTGLMPKAKAGDAKAALVVVKCLERRAKLLGTDAPARSLVGGDPAAPPIQVQDMTDAQRVDRVKQLIAVARRRGATPLLTYEGAATGTNNNGNA
jgi:hypothetical protein